MYEDSPYPTDIREYLYKILVIGDLGTGKTSIIKRYVHNIFSLNYKSTVYYKEAVAALVVYDVTRPKTFEAVSKWKADLDSKVTLPGGDPIPVVLLANKTDLQDETSGGLNPEEMDRFCEENGFLKWFGTSAKDNSNIEDATRFLLEEIMNKEAEHANQHAAIEAAMADRIHLNQPRQKEGCC
ncbi:rab32, member RAS oncoprotein [Haplosporangium sp. Z 11]|nr:rab32, member RAS oncoprotein [Haplosporangium sp. Z 11]